MRRRLLYVLFALYFTCRLFYLAQISYDPELILARANLIGKELPRVACYTGDLDLFFATTYAAIPSVVVWPEQTCDAPLP